MIPSKEEWYRALEEKQGKDLCKKLSHSTVAICGLGGLGSNIANALARAGIGKLILIDHDKVDITNLHRQQYKAEQIGCYKADALKENLKEIAPYTETEIFAVKITEENAASLIEKADIVCEAFDDAQCKAMLADAVLGTMPDKYLVAASGMAGTGDANEIRTRKVTEHFYLCGDQKSDVNDGLELISSRVMLCAAHQAHAVIAIIAETEIDDQ